MTSVLYNMGRFFFNLGLVAIILSIFMTAVMSSAGMPIDSLLAKFATAFAIAGLSTVLLSILSFSPVKAVPVASQIYSFTSLLSILTQFIPASSGISMVIIEATSYLPVSPAVRIGITALLSQTAYVAMLYYLASKVTGTTV